MGTLNERLTEKIIRDHFNRFAGNGVYLHEQRTSNPRINKLLKHASKKSGDGEGCPDFIIEFREHDFLIVIECKASTRKHKSKNLDKPVDYAVDGALHYAAHLVRSYDVLSIGASGTTKKDLRVTHHLALKEFREPFEIFGDTLLPIDDYLNGYLQDEKKGKQDYNELIAFIRDLNRRLHIDKVSEKNRAIFISMLLIALARTSFRNSYRTEKPGRVARLAVDAAIEQLEEAGVDKQRSGTLKQQFNFLRHEKKLLDEADELVNIISDIDEHINRYQQSNKYRDVIGALYIEFLRYANSDKKLGIVLTPHHIAEFFVELAQVNKKSVVYDNCAGTGGFLISAMDKMVKDAKGEEKTIKQIRKNRLFGVELGAPIYPLAVSNMYIHQDGKSNIIHGDCFNPEVKNFIKSKKPTVGILNPPYKADKIKDIEELEFVLNNLECLQQGGKCVAIVPMQCALASSGKIAELKENLMKKHTLEAVLSMPNELFFNSKVNVVTCAMVFTAHNPHPKEKEVYLGYYKDDGFSKNKLRGRADIHEKWKYIREVWIENFINRREKLGLSIVRKLEANEEWCAEAYMKTNYSKMTEDDFMDTIKNYVAYKFLNPVMSNKQS